MRILVAMSGGVDSSVVAGLLREAGHEVIGVTLQLYDHGAATGRKGACCAGQDIHDARRVADHLGIPHYVIDAEQRFADAVIGDFADSYAAGETPVPCVRCNQTVKFADLTALAQGLGCERLATGHYVRRIDGPEGPELHRATDLARDQSWFLFATTREQLVQAIFPLGGMDKRQCATRRSGLVCRWPPSQTARTSASSRQATMPMSSRGCVPTRGKRARSLIAEGTSAVGTTASRGIRSVRGSASVMRRSPAVNARWWWHWTRRAGGS